MSQFRIKKIDQGLVDEWVLRLNDDGTQVGDDIDARDPNGLAEAMIDTQTLLLKTSTLSANAILNSNSGIAERLTLLEETAGEATLQDAYENGNMISILSGQPLILGANEEIKIDDSGNLSFSPTTMRVKGSGISYVELNNGSIHSTLGDFIVGSVSPGYRLSLQSAGDLTFKDNYLNDAITLSETGNQYLDTSSQSIVGAINELKASAFNVSFQSVYDQSTPPKIITNLGSGAVHIEDSNPASLADALKVTGNQTVTKKLNTGSLYVGNNSSLLDGDGFFTSDPIESSVEVITPMINGDLNDLRLQDKRISLTLSDGSVSGLDTSSNSLVGAINELKANLDSIGGSQTYFGIEHDASTGKHGIITTQASLGTDTAKRIIVKNQSGIETFSINGLGAIIAQSMTLAGFDVDDMLSDLTIHLSDDGTSHSAVAAHLSASNPHDVVKSLNSLSGPLNIFSPDGSITVTPSGSNINIQAQESTDLQDAYDRLSTKELDITTATGLKFLDADSSEVIMMLRNIGIQLKRDLNFEYTGAKITGTTDLNLEASTKLSLSSTNDDIEISTVEPTKTTIIEGVPFGQASITGINNILGTSILGALNTLSNSMAKSAVNSLHNDILAGTAINFDPNGYSWLPISDIHPCNRNIEDIDWIDSIQSNPFLCHASIAPEATGNFLIEGTRSLDLGTGIEEWLEGEELFIARKGRAEFSIEDFSLLSDGDTLTIDPTGMNKILTATTGAPIEENGEFLIESSSASSNINSDNTLLNLIFVLNSMSFMSVENEELDMRAALDGEPASAILEITTNPTAGDLVQIIPPADTTGSTIILTAVANGTTPNWTQFEVGRTIADTAKKLAEAINRTTYFGTEDQSSTGHLCLAEQQGDSVSLEWYMPGRTGRDTTISTSGFATFYPFQGGISIARLYRQDLAGLETTIISSNSSAISATNLGVDECESQFIMGKNIKSPSRNVKNEKHIKVGKILEVSGNIASIKIG